MKRDYAASTSKYILDNEVGASRVCKGRNRYVSWVRTVHRHHNNVVRQTIHIYNTDILDSIESYRQHKDATISAYKFPKGSVVNVVNARAVMALGLHLVLLGRGKEKIQDAHIVPLNANMTSKYHATLKKLTLLTLTMVTKNVTLGQMQLLKRLLLHLS